MKLFKKNNNKEESKEQLYLDEREKEKKQRIVPLDRDVSNAGCQVNSVKCISTERICSLLESVSLRWGV